MSYIILRLDGTKEAVGIAEIPNDPDQARMIAQFNVYHRKPTTVCACWITQAEFETYKVLELFPEFGCCYRREFLNDDICTIGVYDPMFFYLENNLVRTKSTQKESIPQYSNISHI